MRLARECGCFRQRRGRVPLNQTTLKDTLTTFSCFLPHPRGFYEDSAAQEHCSAASPTLYD